MENFRIPVSNEYLLALGRATYNFAYLEWVMIYLGHAHDKNFISIAQKLTSKKIAGELKILITEASITTDDIKVKLLQIIDEFNVLTDVRNDLLHSNPYTAEGGGQRLQYGGGRRAKKDWPIEDIFKAALDFENLAISANDLYHSQLKNP